MKRTNLLKTAAVLTLLACAASLSAQDGATRIVPDEFLRSWDPVTLIFDSNVGPAQGGSADEPGSLFRIEPDHAGEYRWVDARTLQFLPADPWPPLATISVTSGDSEFALQTLMAPPTSVVPYDRASNLEPVDRITVTLPEWVDPARLAAMIEIEARPLPGLEGQSVVRLDENDISIRIQDPREGTERATAVVELSEPIGYGREITFAIRLAEGASSDAHVASYSFSTRPLFRLVAMGSGNVSLPVSSRGSLYATDQAIAVPNQHRPLFLQFSEPLGHLSLEEVKRLVHFTPAVRNFSFEVTNNRLYLHLDADAEIPYELHIEHEPILSSGGRVLAEFDRSGLPFYFQRQQPYLRWENGEAIVERFGPQVFPMEGRGVGRIDLRVYEIDPYDRDFWPFSSTPLSVDEESRPPMPGESIQTRERAVRALGSPNVSSIISLPIEESSPSTDFGLDLSPFFEEINGEQAPGTYLVGYRALGSDQSRQYVRVVVTDLDLSAVEEEHAVNFVVTSLSTGKPIRGATVTIEGQERGGEGYVTVVQGTTDNEGVFRYEHRNRIEETIRRIAVTYSDDTLTFDPSDPPPAFSNNHWHGSTTRWLSWLNQEPVSVRDQENVKGYLLTERPIYRPEEPVHILGYVRSRRSGAILRDSRATERRLDIRGPGASWTYEVELDEFGQFHVEFHESDVPTGRYVANLFDAELGRSLATVDFQIESYRVPRFEVQIHGLEQVPVDEPFSMELVAEYYAGGRVIGRPVFWRVTESEYQRRPVGFPGFSFSSYESIGTTQRHQASGITRQDTTDETGLAGLTIDPTRRQNASAVRYLVEGTVDGADGQRVTAVKSVVALPPFSVGIKQERFVRDAQRLSPQIVVLDFNAEPLAGIEYAVRVYQRQWHSYLAESDFVTGAAEYRSDVVDELILEETYTSTDEIAEPSFALEESGVYIIEVLARDNLGRLQTVRVDTYVPGTSPVAWDRTEANVFQTTADKDAYQPGDTARILLQSPFQEGAALAVIEGPLSISYEWVEISGGQGILEVPIGQRMVPRLPVHFLLMRGRVPGTESRYAPAFDRGRPISVANTTYLQVLPVYHEAIVDLDYPERNLPGSSIQMEIELTDFRGTPLNGQVALWLVDRAVLSLAEEKPIEPLQAFIDPVTSSITIRDTRNRVVGNLPFKENPGGGGWERAAEASLLDRTTVRRNFQTVPYFNPAIEVEGGRATVTINLPDNLTDFAVRAVAVSGYSQFGTASGLINVRLPVIMQTALPRFVRPGDRFEAGGVARIVEGPGGASRVEIRTEGIELASGGSEARRTVNLERGIASNQYFDLVVPSELEGGTVSVSLGVERLVDAVSDAFELELPVQDGVFLEARTTFTQSSDGAESAFPVTRGEFRDGTLRQQAVVTTDENVIRMLGGLRFMSRTPQQTAEQWTSALRAILLLQSILREADWDREFAVTQSRWEEYLSYLDTVRAENGLYAQFPQGRGLVSLTAWVLDAMTLAEQAGLQTPAATRDRTIRVLEEALRSDYRYLISDLSFQERVEALSALGRAGRFDDSYAQSFVSSATSQNLYSAALLVSAFGREGRLRQSRLQRVVDHLWGSTTFRLEGGERYFTGLNYATRTWGGYLMTSDVRTIAAVIRALAMADPNDNRLPIMTEYLLRQGNERGWGSTANTIEVLDTLSYLLTSGTSRLMPTVRFRLRFGDRTETLALANNRVVGSASEVQSPGSIEQIAGSGEPWVYLEARFRPDLLASRIRPRNDGFVVNRELQLVESDRVVRRTDVDRGRIALEQDAVVEEHVTLSNPEHRYYVAVHVPLAAGFEALNPELDTSGSEAVPIGRLSATPTYVRFLDDSVTYYYESLPAGTYHFYFRERATFAGQFQLPPAWAEAIYDPGVWGNSAGALIAID
ncbi:MAG: alpha-2-macroglobulin family protein [Spirochaetota bacterium]